MNKEVIKANKEAAVVYDNYVLIHNLEHTTNGLGTLPSRLRE
jgi:hypothetical protein